MSARDQPPELTAPTHIPTRSTGALAADLTMPLALGGGGLFVVLQAQGIASAGGYSPVGPSFFPTVIGALMLLLAPVLAIGAWRASGTPLDEAQAEARGEDRNPSDLNRNNPQPDAADGVGPKPPVARIAALGWLLAAVAIGALGIERVGFVPAMTAAFVLAAQAFPGRPGLAPTSGLAAQTPSAGTARGLLGDVVVALLFALTTWFLFTVGLGLRLPAGWLSALPGA